MCHVTNLTAEQTAAFEALPNRLQDVFVRELERNGTKSTPERVRPAFERFLKLAVGEVPSKAVTTPDFAPLSEVERINIGA